MRLIKTIKNGKSEIEIYDSDISENEKKANLISLYKTINDIADKQRAKGINVDDWFYSKKQLEAMKQSGNYNFYRI